MSFTDTPNPSTAGVAASTAGILGAVAGAMVPKTTSPQSQSNANAIPIPQSQIQNDFQGFVQPFSNQEMQQTIKEATTPIPGGHSQNIPTALQHKDPQQFQGAPLDNRQVVGAGNAKAQGIGNTVTAALNTISGVLIKKKQADQAKVADAASIVFEAQKNIDDAKQQLKLNPNDQAAQRVLAQNTARVNNLDPKMQKAIAKGLQIDYTDPSKNKTDEHIGVQSSISQLEQKAKDTQTFEQRLSAGLPQGMASNQQAIAKYQYMEKANKDAQDIWKTYSTNMAHITAAQYAKDGRIGSAEIVQTNANLRSLLNTQTRFSLQANEQQFKDEQRKARYTDETNLILKRASAQVNAHDQILTLDAQDPAKRATAMTKNLSELDGTIAKTESQIVSLTNNMATLAPEARGPQQAEIQRLREFLDGSTDTQGKPVPGFKQYRDNVKQFYMQAPGGFSYGGANSNNTGAGTPAVPRDDSESNSGDGGSETGGSDTDSYSNWNQ